MRKVIRNTVKFTTNPEGKQDNAECVAAGKYKREDGEAFLRSTGSLVDAVDWLPDTQRSRQREADVR